MPLPLFAFGWISLPLLGWLAAAAAPLLIHLWSRRRYRETTWAAMDFLLAAMQRQARRLLLEQWLLLLVRTMIVVLVVSAVAEPYFERSGLGASFMSGGRTHHVLVLDGSFSMGYTPDEKSRFDQAKELARNMVQKSSPSDVFTLVLMAAPPQTLVGTAALSPSAMAEEIDRVRLPHGTADLPATVAMVQELVKKVAKENPQIGRHDVVFFTDLQRLTWSPKLADVAKKDFQQQTKLLASVANLLVVDLGRPTDENTAAVDLHAENPLLTVDGEATFIANLKHFGRHIPERPSAEWFLDGRRMTQTPVQFSPEGTATARFTHRFETPGDHAIEFRVSGDPLKIDNHRFCIASVRPAIRVLCIDGRPSGEPFAGAADYLAVALRSRGAATAAAKIKADVASENAILERGLSAYDCVFFCNVAQFTASEARTIDAYLQAGGNVVFWLGDRVLPDRYNAELGVADEIIAENGAGQGRADAQQSQHLAILPGRLGRVIEKSQYRLDPNGFHHPIARAFQGQGEKSLLTTPVFKYFAIQMPKDTKATTVLSLGDGEPLLVERPTHRGRVFLMATSAEPAWTALPLWPSFVPLVHEIVANCMAGESRRQNISVGEPIEILSPNSFGDKPPSVVLPDGTRSMMQVHSTPGGYCADFAETMQSGVYSISADATSAGGRKFAVNVEPAESDLSQTTPEELRDETLPGVSFQYQTGRVDVLSIGGNSGKNRVHVSLLYAALCLLLFETYLAHRMTSSS